MYRLLQVVLFGTSTRTGYVIKSYDFLLFRFSTVDAGSSDDFSQGSRRLFDDVPVGEDAMSSNVTVFFSFLKFSSLESLRTRNTIGMTVVLKNEKSEQSIEKRTVFDTYNGPICGGGLSKVAYDTLVSLD